MALQKLMATLATMVIFGEWSCCGGSCRLSADDESANDEHGDDGGDDDEYRDDDHHGHGDDDYPRGDHDDGAADAANNHLVSAPEDEWQRHSSSDERARCSVRERAGDASAS